MGTLSAFITITLNGYFEASTGDISWHQHGPEEEAFSAESLKTGNTLLFGRTTYEQMAGFWPTEAAMEHFPVIAEGMNTAKKIVFSRTLEQTSWNNTSIVSQDMLEEVTRMKEQGENMTLLGSGSILAQLAEAGLIDEYQIMIDPVAIGKGTTLFGGMKERLSLQLTHSRVHNSGVVFLVYQPRAS